MTGEPGYPRREALPTFTSPEDVLGDAEAQRAAAEALVAEITATAALPEAELTYENTLGTFDRMRNTIGWEGAGGRLQLLVGAVHPDASIRAAAKEAQVGLDEYWRGTFFNRDLYVAIKRFADSEAATALAPDSEERRLLDDTMLQFRLAGQELDADKRGELQALHTRLATIGAEFRDNIDQDETKLALTVEELDGLPGTFVADLARGDDGETWLVGLSDPEFNMVLSYAKNRDLRERMYKAFYSVGIPRNLELIAEAAERRQRIATLLGYECYMDTQLEGQMAGDRTTVEAFYGDFNEPVATKATAEVDAMRPLLNDDGHAGPIQAWDVLRYKTILRELSGVDDKAIAEYLPADAVIQGLFNITSQIFGVRYERIEGAETWHKDVQAYRMFDVETGEPITTFYLDLFPRTEKEKKAGVKKREGAANYMVEPGCRLASGEYQEPVTYLVANLTPPGADGTPALLQPNDLRVLFNRFGQLLHTAFARTETVRFSGDNTQAEFRGAVALMLARWATIPDVIEQLASHYQTGERIPADLIANLSAVQQITSGIDALRLVQTGRFDFGMHGPPPDPGRPHDMKAIYQDTERYAATDPVEGINWAARLRQLFTEGYPGNYHGYAWSQVFAAEILNAFYEPGADQAIVGRRFRKLLTHGGSRPVSEIMQKFLGRSPSQQALRQWLGGLAASS
ncbi:MAG TPA: M3 family metallopeptidase [Candidatus Saccharimonadales bacterium]|nr:M3 family metallopeptidase [Candidatus Saccharimonadales bacterium]